MNKLDKLALQQQTQLAQCITKLQKYIELGVTHEELNNDCAAEQALEELVELYHKHYGEK